MEVGVLEGRLLLSVESLNSLLSAALPATNSQILQLATSSVAPDDTPDPEVPLPTTPSPGAGQAQSATGAKHPLSDVPALSSLPGAPASLYLDFTGDFTGSYGSYSNITTPAFDQDGDPTTFNDDELAAIQQVWSCVAEDYAPFNLNVTTVPPASMAHGVTEKVDIGGNGAWTGSQVGGLTYVNDFTQTGVPNIAFVFSQNLASGNARYTGDAVAHESGHGFGLLHQSTYSGTTKTAEYSTGPGDGTAPIMGNAYAARRTLWWYGQSSSSSTSYQDDMAILSGSTDGFGYRQDADANTAANPTPLTVANGGQVNGSGLIITTSDFDYYSFNSGAGAVSFTVSVPADLSTLAPRVELLDSTGSTIIASAGPSATDFSATIVANLTAAGSYRLLVTSNGGYGNVGHYSISGTIIAGVNQGTGTGSAPGPVSSPITPPINLCVSGLSPNQVNLAWTDTTAAASGYLVERSQDGVNWGMIITNLPPSASSFTDTTVSPGCAYSYRVRATSTGGPSAPSAIATVITPGKPLPPTKITGLTVVAQGPNRVLLIWQPSANAKGYLVQRSTNGKTWTAVGNFSGGAASFVDTSVGANRIYYYRVRAWNSSTVSPFGAIFHVKTPKAVVAKKRAAKTIALKAPVPTSQLLSPPAASLTPHSWITFTPSAPLSRVAFEATIVDQVVLGWLENSLQFGLKSVWKR
jgi:hypothetical protein